MMPSWPHHDRMREAIFAGDRGLAHDRGLRAIITCEACGERHRLERTFSRPGTFWLVCHGCELSLRVEIDELDLAAVL